MALTDPDRFVRAYTRVGCTTLVPEIRLYQASEITPIWQASEEFLSGKRLGPPFWAFAWPGGQALARFVLDQPERVAGRRVLDFAAGSGIAAIACARARAASVLAADLDPFACAAIAANAQLNGVAVAVANADLVGAEGDWDCVLCGDICYEAPMAARIMPWLRRLAGTAEVWLADPGRAYLPRESLARFATYRVATTLELEDRSERETVVYRVRAIA